MKLEQKETINRLVIYFFYDADGIVDRYVPYMLEDINKNCSELFVVCNGKLTPEGRKTFLELTPHLLVRENVGFDVWAYKEALEHYGWEKLAEFDEVVLMNYTIFGPLYPFSEMFEKMNQRDVDFWGITKHHKVDFDCFNTCKYKYIPEHVQSNFLVIRKSLITSLEYQTMWDNMPMIHSYAESVGFYEAIFTKEFEDKGFRWEVFIDTSDLEEYTRYPLMMMADELIANRRCPIIKVKSFSQNYYDFLGDTIGNSTVEVFNYIKNNLDYDTDFIWEHIIRTANMADIKRLMHLNYILPNDFVTVEPKTTPSQIALMMHLYYPDLVDCCFEYGKSMPAGSDLIVTVPNKKMEGEVRKKAEALALFRKIKVIVVENRGRDVSALLVGCAPYISDYKYVCFVHDKKTTQLKPYCVGESFAYKCFENNLGSRAYVKNIITTFESNPRLGLLTPPPPNHGSFYQIVGSEWASNYENTLALATKLDLHVNIYWDKEPIAPLGTMFWFRVDAMKKLFDYAWKYDDFPKEPNRHDGTILHAIERIYPFVAQDAGYYSAWLMMEQFAQMEITNLQFMLREINLKLFANYYTTTLQDMTEKMSKHMRFDFTGRRKLKLILKKFIPKPVWNLMRKIYCFFGGEKWVG